MPNDNSQKVALQAIDEFHDLSQQVFFRRDELGLTQEGLATAAGMTQAQVANIEAGHANPTVRTLVKLADALGCRIMDLFRPDEEVLAVPYSELPAGLIAGVKSFEVIVDPMKTPFAASLRGGELVATRQGDPRQADWSPIGIQVRELEPELESEFEEVA